MPSPPFRHAPAVLARSSLQNRLVACVLSRRIDLLSSVPPIIELALTRCRGIGKMYTDRRFYLAGGMSEEEILRDFPSLTQDHIRDVLAYAAEREHRYVRHTAA